MSETDVINELKRVARRVDQAVKVLEIVEEDRSILEDILSRLTAVESALNLNRAKQMEVAKDARADINEVKDVVEAKVGEVAQLVDEKTVVVKTPHQSVVQGIMQKMEKAVSKDVETVRQSKWPYWIVFGIGILLAIVVIVYVADRPQPKPAPTPVIIPTATPTATPMPTATPTPSFYYYKSATSSGY